LWEGLTLQSKGFKGNDTCEAPDRHTVCSVTSPLSLLLINLFSLYFYITHLYTEEFQEDEKVFQEDEKVIQK
jgi:hypothetical protein